MSVAEFKNLPAINQHSLDYYRCPSEYCAYQLPASLSDDERFFRWRQNIVCYGRVGDALAVPEAGSGAVSIPEASGPGTASASLTFDPQEVIENLQRERYSSHSRETRRLSRTVLRKAYYLARPYLTVPARAHVQRMYFRNWDKIAFPEWPIDTTVDRIHRELLKWVMRARCVDKVPFIWFWPDGYSNCTIVTHDVENVEGKNFCHYLMDTDQSFGFRSSFQIVPEDRYKVTDAFLESIRDRGCEVNVHDLKHDGHLFTDRKEFLRRAKKINQYAREFGAAGFRSGIMYRNADWYDAFDFNYDMSLPNVAHLDPQHGGCCTVMPFFIGDMVELPLTCTQDYSLFHILRTYSTDLWKRQIAAIRNHAGLVSILVHPDYLAEERARNVYRQLLGHLAELRDEGGTWTPLPGEVAAWWRERRKMKVVQDHAGWKVAGPGSDRARVAFACLENDEVVYRLEDRGAPSAIHDDALAGVRATRS